MSTTKIFSIFALISTFFILSVPVFGQQSQYVKPVYAGDYGAFSNPLMLDAGRGCQSENLNEARFDRQISANQRMLFCETLREISMKLNRSWSPALKSELRQIWQVFSREDIKIRPIGQKVPAKIRAMAEAFTENNNENFFTANLHIRFEQIGDDSFFPIFIHELRHIFDLFTLWKNKTAMTEAELEKRAFRIVGKINQELPDSNRFAGLPTFWDAAWKRLTPTEIDRNREQKIEQLMRNSSAYKHLLINPEDYLVGYLPKKSGHAELTDSFEEGEAKGDTTENRGEKLPRRLRIRQTEANLPQQVKEIAFKPEKAAAAQNADELLRAALINEKNLYLKMDNFVYDQKLQLQCWKKQKVIENFESSSAITRTTGGKALFQNQPVANSLKPPSCVRDFDAIKSDATDTFWAAPYLDQMTVKFDYFTVVDGIAVARYTVYEPTGEKFNRIASAYPNIKPFRAFVGTIFVSVKDAQIIKFWGTSFPAAATTGNHSPRTFGSYCATAIRQKLASGIWVTTLLNIVAVADDKNKLKPFSYIVNYQNYRQAATDVKILDDVEQVASK